jgi:hypothetical protein
VAYEQAGGAVLICMLLLYSAQALLLLTSAELIVSERPLKHSLFPHKLLPWLVAANLCASSSRKGCHQQALQLHDLACAWLDVRKDCIVELSAARKYKSFSVLAR